MPKGPQESRLDTYVTHGDSATIGLAASTWGVTAGVLRNLARALDSAEPHLLDRFGPQTGAAAVKAFDAVRQNVIEQAKQMEQAQGALDNAGAALSDAESLHQSLNGSSVGPEPQPPTQKAGESHEDFALRQQDASRAHSAYAAEYHRRETQSAQKTGAVDTHYTAAVKVMEQIHGNPNRPHTGGGGGGGGGSTTGGFPGSTGGRLPTGGGTHQSGHLPGTNIGDPHTTEPHHHHHHGHVVDPPYIPPTNGGDDPPGYVPTDGGGDPPVYGNPGETQGPGYSGGTTSSTGTLPGSSGTSGTSGASGTTGSLPGSSVAVGGVLGGGMLGGASGLSGALRGATAASGALAEESVLGTSSRASGASSGALGRGGAAGGTGSSSRSPGSGRGGSGRGAGGGGGGAGGRGNKKGKKGKKPGVDFFEDNDDWLDDDEPAPGVLD